MRRREVQAVVEAYVPDIGLYGKCVQVAAAVEAKVVECDVFITEGGEVDIQVEQVVPGIDTAAHSCVVESFQVFIEEVDIFFHFFGRDHEGEVLVGGQ